MKVFEMRKTADKNRMAFPALAAAAILLTAAAAAAALLPTRRVMSEKEYFGITKDYEVGVVCGGERAGAAGRVIDGEIYLDYDCVRRCVNPSVYYDEPAERLIVTKPQEILTVDLSGGTPPGREAGFLDGTLYISLAYLESVTDMETEVYDDPVRRVFIDTEWTYELAELPGKTRVRSGPGKKKKILAEYEAGSRIRLSPEEGEEPDAKWVRVITDTGLAGYTEARRLGERTAVDLTDAHSDPAFTFTKRTYDGTVNLVFHQTDNQASNDALPAALEGVKGADVIAPTWYYLDGTDGTLRDVSSRTYVEYAHAAGMEVWAVFNDFDGACSSTDETARFLADWEARRSAAEAVVSSLVSCGADGLNLDFELVRDYSAETFLEFVRELAAEARKAGLVFSVDNYVPAYTSYMNRGEQARVADFIVTMCYDEHTAGSSEAGSVSSLPFVEKGLRDTLKEVPPGQLIAALPFFTRLWTTEKGSAPGSRALGMRDAENALAEYGMTARWDEKTGQNYAEIQEGNILRRIWLEDGESIAAKLKAASEYGCAGFAWWKLGLEKSEIWDLISGYCA